MRADRAWMFLRLVGAAWASLVTGSFSALLVLLGIGINVAGALGYKVPGDQIAQLSTWSLAALCGAIAAFSVWSREHEEKLELQGRLDVLMKKPALRLSFNMNDPGCVRRNTIVSMPVRITVRNRPDLAEEVVKQANCDWYRIRIDAENGNVPGCQAHLMSVLRGGSPLLSGEVPPLPIVHAVDGVKTVHNRIPDYIDLLAVFDNAAVDLCVPAQRRSSSIHWNMFDLAGEFRITVAVTSPDAETASIDVIFRWNLNRATAEIACAPKQ